MLTKLTPHSHSRVNVNVNVKTTCGYEIGPQDQWPDCEECDLEFCLDLAVAMHLTDLNREMLSC